MERDEAASGALDGALEMCREVRHLRKGKLAWLGSS